MHAKLLSVVFLIYYKSLLHHDTHVPLYRIPGILQVQQVFVESYSLQLVKLLFSLQSSGSPSVALQYNYLSISASLQIHLFSVQVSIQVKFTFSRN